MSLVNMGASQTLQCAPTKATLHYVRDRAGWNNIRITFESLVCVARLTNRQLVLPPPSNVQHQELPFHELQVYDVPSLARAVLFANGASPPTPPYYPGSLVELLAEDPQTSVTVDPDVTRLQHFECLELSGERARSAAEAVLSMDFATPYKEAARSALHRAGLEAGEYCAVHLRRGDFAHFRPETQWDGKTLASMIERALPAGLPLVVACAVDGKEEDPYPELAAGLAGRRVLRTDDLYTSFDGALHRTVVDTLILSLARGFAGTPDSTFSTGVWHWRARERVLRGEDPEVPVTLGPKVDYEGQSCWQKTTKFTALAPNA